MENIATSADVMAIINIKDIRIILSIILVRKKHIIKILFQKII